MKKTIKQRFRPALSVLEDRLVLSSVSTSVADAVHTDFATFAGSYQAAQSTYATSPGLIKLERDQDALAKLLAVKTPTPTQKTDITKLKATVAKDKTAVKADASTLADSVTAAVNTLGTSLSGDLAGLGLPSNQISHAIDTVVTGAALPGSVTFQKGPIQGSLQGVLGTIGVVSSGETKQADHAIRSALDSFETGIALHAVTGPTSPSLMSTEVNAIHGDFATFAGSYQAAQSTYATSPSLIKLERDQDALAKLLKVTTPTANQKAQITKLKADVVKDKAAVKADASTLADSVTAAVNTLGTSLSGDLTGLGLPANQVAGVIDTLVTGAALPGSVSFQNGASTGSLQSILMVLGPQTSGNTPRINNAIYASLNGVQSALIDL